MAKNAKIKKIVNALDERILSCLPQFHALTGCDTTSYFYNQGKTASFKKTLKDPDSLSLIRNLGVKRCVAENDTFEIMKFIQTVIYSGKSNEDYVSTRVRLYENLKKKSSLCVPPDPKSFV